MSSDRRKYVHNTNKNYSSLNPLTLNKMTNLAFVVKDTVLGDEATSIIMSLVDEFNRITTTDLKHNIELSQYYSVDKPLLDKNNGVVCDNCEITLKYIDTAICINSNKIEINPDNSMDCTINRGLIKFYLKELNGNCVTYTKIHVVDVKFLDSIDNYTNLLYQNNKELGNLSAATQIALSRCQSDAIKNTAKGGQLDSTTENDLINSSKTVNNIINQAKNAAVRSQLTKLVGGRVISLVPDQSSINAADVVANAINKSGAANKKELTSVLVPGNQPIQLNPDNSNKIQAKMTTEGIKPIDMPKTNARAVNQRASIGVDANLAVVPKNNIVSNPNLDITPSSSKTSIKNILVSKGKDLESKIKNVIDNPEKATEIINKAKPFLEKSQTKINDIISQTKPLLEKSQIKTNDFIDQTKKILDNLNNLPNTGNKTDNIISNSSKLASNFLGDIKNVFSSLTKSNVIPVSQNMSVMTKMPINQAKNMALLPTMVGGNNVDQNVVDKYDNKINEMNDNITIPSNSKASLIINDNLDSDKINNDNTYSIKLSDTISYKNTRKEPIFL